MTDFDALDYMDDEDIATMIHDEDSDRPNSIIDDEPELTQEEQFVQDIIDSTREELEEKINGAVGSNEITISRGIALQALQLIKAYSAMFTLTFDDYNYDYD